MELKVNLHIVNGDTYNIYAEWENAECQLSLKNISDQTICLHKIPVFTMDMTFSQDTFVYGEGYNKLSQYAGTVSDLEMIGAYGDFQHYKLPKPDGCYQVYNIIRFTPEKEPGLLMGFTSCNRFGGEFWFDEQEIWVTLNLEGIEIAPGETIELEHFFAGTGKKTELEEHFAAAIQTHHPKLQTAELPIGWSSWPVYGPEITAQKIYDNLEAIREKKLELKYIQIDDGYQKFMGDWLSSADTFEGGVESVCRNIKERGFEPAIWAAPFIAEEQSQLFRDHPDWFVKDDNGKPLASDQVSFGGWRCAPWYMLDGTHPEARRYLKEVFRTMREEWGVRYFKLDANMWGALPFGIRYEKNRTCIEAYRMGMEAVLEGAGKDSFVIGCNAPMWPSLGLVHAMRVTNDNSRKFQKLTRIARECFYRNWQNGRLWVNDPDTVLMRNCNLSILDPAGRFIDINSELSQDEFQFHMTYILASGGIVLCGDNMMEFTEDNIRDMKKLIPPTGAAAVFDTDDLSMGRIELEREQLICLFNESPTVRDFSIAVDGAAEVIDFWSDEVLDTKNQEKLQVRVAGHGASVLRMIKSEKDMEKSW